MLRSLLIFILCGMLAACSAERDVYTFDAKTKSGDDALMVCVKDPAQGLANSTLVGDYQLLADGKSYLATVGSQGDLKQLIFSPINAEPCKSLIEGDADKAEEAAKVTAAVLLGIPICILIGAGACPI